MNKHYFIIYLACAASLLFAEPFYKIDFKNLTQAEQDTLKLAGKSESTPEGIMTTSVRNADSIVKLADPIKEIPDGFDGKILRVTWSFIPLKIGGWGNEFCIGSTMIVELTGTKPTLNGRHSANLHVEEGQPCTMSCDFSRYLVTSWTINGQEQLKAPVPAWKKYPGQHPFSFADFYNTDSKTLWLNMSCEYVQYPYVHTLQCAAGDDFPVPKLDGRCDFLLAQASPMEKIFRDAQQFTGSFSRNVHIAAAGRERESFQLAVMPLDKPLKNVTMTVTELRGEDSAVLPSTAISVHPIGYIQLKAGNRRGWFYPDVLMPNKPFDVEPGFVQPVWFTVDVPADTPHGKYHGIIHVKADGLEEQFATLSLTVRPFNLPLRGKLKTAFCICPGLWEIWYEPDEVRKRLGMDDRSWHNVLFTSYECEDVLPKSKWLEMYDFLLAHRLNPTVIYSELKRGKSRLVPAMEDMQYCYDRGMNATCLTSISGISENEEEAEKYLQDLHAWLTQCEQFVKEKNWQDFTWYLHSYDESEMQPSDVRKKKDVAIAKTHSFVKEHFPWLKRETANPFIERNKDYFDIWTPLTDRLVGKHLEDCRKAQEAGQEVWAYVCCGPGEPYANFFPEMSGVCPRILPWQLFQYKLTGFLYYLINHFEREKNWNKNAPKWPDLPWNCLALGVNSDGILIYPGPDATPLASTRLENLRDGIEDYEALAMLQSLAEGFTPNSEEEIAALEEAKAMIQVPKELSSSWAEFTKDPQVIVKNRAKIDALIQKLQRK